MSYYIIIRGPAGSGKSTIAARLAKELGAYCIHLDSILAQHHLDVIEGDGISTENFTKGNDLIINTIKGRLQKDQIVIIDACFYRKGHLDHVIRNLPSRHVIFSLKASLAECIRRNNARRGGMTEKDIRAVFSLVSRLDAGTPIPTEGRTVDQVVEDIKGRLPSRQARLSRRSKAPRA